jgi:hypothetical protein
MYPIIDACRCTSFESWDNPKRFSKLHREGNKKMSPPPEKTDIFSEMLE